jgi:hypothetical protein
MLTCKQKLMFATFLKRMMLLLLNRVCRRE